MTQRNTHPPSDAMPPDPIHPAPLAGGWDVLHRLAFYPILLTIGPWVKFNTVRLQEPKGPREGVAGDGRDLRLLIAGDSSAAGVGVSTQSQALSGQLVGLLSKRARVDWQLIARCGDSTPQALARLKAAQPRRADVAVTGLGVNDVIRGTRLSVWLDQQRALLSHLIDTVGIGHVYVSGLPPVYNFPRLTGPLRWAVGHRAARFDRALQTMLKDHPQATHIPASMVIDAEVMAEDGFHPGPRVYTEWAHAAARLIIADHNL
ncbi:SGNH/GDSL hydrolase family protein [Pseudooctadecabacter sp.]|uniref:SGNH/GDSL hydrolase family protein n=1 Tax=Pseudooctadecabacter sp. TaxID=1966338 RepID=UPI003F6C0057